MRRGCSVGVGAGSSGFNKPPPAPLSHGGGRVRLQMPDSNSSLQKDRFGSPRERSPNMGNSLPLSPSHPNSREKSPNPTAQDLHDCSMCLSAYIQSLNTVCGTACRLTQCLAQVASENSSSDSSSTGLPLPQVVKDAADIWEGIARAVGVASAAAKTQMIVMLQEAQSRNSDYIDVMRRQEVVKQVVQAMLSTFLNLHCQFSVVVIERFSGMLQQLMEETVMKSHCPNSVSAGLLDGSHRPSPPPPHSSPLHPNKSQVFFHSPVHQNVSASTGAAQQLLLQKQLLQQQQQQAALQQMLHMAQQQQQLQPQVVPAKTNTNETSVKEPNIITSKQPCSCSASWSANLGSPNATLANTNSSLSVNPSQGNNNTLSPSFYSGFSGMNCGSHEWSNDAVIRRWSMGGPFAEGWNEKTNCLSPFSLIANRRWSVPEASEHDPNGGFGLHPFCSVGGINGLEWSYGSSSIGSRSQNSFKGSKGTLQTLHDGCSSRSPSHSRSVTPDQTRRSSSVTDEEIQSIVDLLSIPLDFCKSLDASSATSDGLEQQNSDSKQRHPQRLQDPSASRSKRYHTRESLNKETSDVKGFSEAPASQCSQERKEKRFGRSETDPPEDKSRISTPLWPPTETVPGVTLTECSGDEEKPVLSSWSDDNDCDRPTFSPFTRDSPTRGSWPPVTSSAKSQSCYNWSFADDFCKESADLVGGSGGWPPPPPPLSLPPFRRHSTDAPYFFTPQGQHPPLPTKTRSFENIAKMNASDTGKLTSIDSNIESLLYLSSLLPDSNLPSDDSQYSLFTPIN